MRRAMLILFDSLDEAMKRVFKGAMVSDERNDLQFMLNDSKDKIEQWKFHILQSCQEKRTPQEYINESII